MKYRIVTDSCCDMRPGMVPEENLVVVPFGLSVGEWSTQDDAQFDQLDFIRRMKEYSGAPKSACPSPDSFLSAFEEEGLEAIFVVCISSKLSGAHNCAVQAKAIYEEEHGKGAAPVHVFDSKSACCGEACVALKIRELVDEGCSFEQVVEQVEKFIEGMHTYFVLDSCENLRKNGRLSNLAANVISALNIKPIMRGNDGLIEKAAQDISSKRALLKMANLCAKEAVNPQERTLLVTQINNEERGRFVLDAITKQVQFKDACIVAGHGLSTLYADDGGIVVAF